MRIEFVVNKGFARKGMVTEVSAERGEQLIASGFAVEIPAAARETILETPEAQAAPLETTADAPAKAFSFKSNKNKS